MEIRYRNSFVPPTVGLHSSWLHFLTATLRLHPPPFDVAVMEWSLTERGTYLDWSVWYHDGLAAATRSVCRSPCRRGRHYNTISWSPGACSAPRSVVDRRRRPTTTAPRPELASSGAVVGRQRWNCEVAAGVASDATTNQSTWTALVDRMALIELYAYSWQYPGCVA